MDKIKYLIIGFIFLSINLIVKADTCSSDELKRLTALAEKTEFSYDYKIVDHKNKEETWQTIEFSITALNLNSELKTLIVYDIYQNDVLEFKTNAATLKGFSEGEKVNVTFKAYTKNDCSGKTVLTKAIKLPYYNQYYDTNFCKENVDFKYCKVLLSDKITNDEYYSALNKYYSEKYSEEIPSDFEYDDNGNNWLMIIIIAVASLIVIIVIISIIIKRRRKNAL